MPHLSKLSEPRQRGAIISVTLITLSADLLSMHHGLGMVTHDFVTNPTSDVICREVLMLLHHLSLLQSAIRARRVES